MVYVSLITITATNTPQSISPGVRVPCTWVSLQSDPANANNAYHGPSNMTINTGLVIGPGGGGAVPQYPPIGDITPYDLQLIYVAGTSGEKVRVMYAKR